MQEKCLGCGVALDQRETEITHAYIGASSSCWQLYSDILAKEYDDPEYFKCHRVTVDAYAASHIGDQNDRRARQSANIHLIALYLKFERKFSDEQIGSYLAKATEIKHDWPRLVQRNHPKWLTVLDIIPASDSLSHQKLVHQWGMSVWEAYRDIHDEIRLMSNFKS